MDGEPTRSNVRIGFALAPLPLLTPEPILTDGDGEVRSEFDDAIFPLGYLNLRSRLVKSPPAANVRRQGEDAARLQCQIAVEPIHIDHRATMQQSRNTVNPVWKTAPACEPLSQPLHAIGESVVGRMRVHEIGERVDVAPDRVAAAWPA